MAHQLSSTMTAKIPSGKELRTRVMLADSMASLPAFAVLLFYVWILLTPSAAEWQSFFLVSAMFGVAVYAICEPIRRRMVAPIVQYLDSKREGREQSSEIREAFRTVHAMPRSIACMSLVVWGVGAAVIPVAFKLLGHPGWAEGVRLVVLILAAISGGFVSSALGYFFFKRTLREVGEIAAADLPDSSERSDLIVTFSLVRKLQYVIVGCGATTLAFGMALSYSRAYTAIHDTAAQWQGQALEALVPAAQDGQLGEAVAEFWRDGLLLPYPATFTILKADEARAVSLLERGSRGALSSLDMGPLESWRTLVSGQLLVAETPRDALTSKLGGVAPLLAIVVAISSGLLWLIASVFAGDMRRATDALRIFAEQMAEGDLRQVRALESEDELGDLARAFDRTRRELQSTMLRVAAAADQVDLAASGMQDSTSTLVGEGSQQIDRIEQAGSLMAQINNQVSEIAVSAQALNISVEESSSSILELGAAGDELNETASVLSGKVDEVSTSIEQMVRSVKQVGTSAEDLSDVASETSSSMEEMASAMRAVDATAELAAELSREVVDSSESGQTKVAQTIGGMEAIREATDAAESVIRGLGARASEIGAILDVIDDVADETNLLALNAAIIAAQAGDHGRAFSVVADEIKELADRVLVSTKEIGGLIRAVQDESTNAIEAIERGSVSVAEGVDLSAQAGTSLEEITRASRGNGDRMAEIVSAVREQTKAATHVVSLMERVRGGVEQISSAGAEQDRGHEVVYRSVVTMREVAQQVRRTTGEQSRGFGRIRESVEGVREAAEQINSALQEQSDATQKVMEFLEQAAEGSRGAGTAGDQLNSSQAELVQQAEALRLELARFRL